MDVRKHVNILGILYIVFGCLYALGGLIFITGMSTLGDLADDGLAEGLFNFSGVAVGLVLFVFAALQIVAGIGLRKYENWARILTIIISVLSLFSFPIGTAIGVYGLWILFKSETQALFERGHHPTRY